MSQGKDLNRTQNPAFDRENSGGSAELQAIDPANDDTKDEPRVVQEGTGYDTIPDPCRVCRHSFVFTFVAERIQVPTEQSLRVGRDFMRPYSCEGDLRGPHITAGRKYVQGKCGFENGVNIKSTARLTPVEKHNYPKSILFIVGNEFCERFSFYGMRTILSLYLKYQLDFDNDFATVIYHVFIMFCFFFPIVGAILADSWLGKFRTIFYLSVVYMTGNILISVAAIPNVIPPREFTMIGLLLVALGTGGIKPCGSAFGGDQFVLPEQEDQLQKFFSLFYFSINAGSFISTILTPVLREDVKCFGQDSCYSLAFGIPAALMMVALVLFVAGKRWYKIKEPEGNIIVKVCKCVWYAARKKVAEKREHWMYKADDKYDRGLIEDIIATFRVLVLVIPLPIFWALFDQQGSRWTFQATRMDIEIGAIKIKPDQIQVANPIMILIFIPLFETVIYPLLGKCNLLTRPLQRLTVGGFLAGFAFFISALLEATLEPTYAVLPQPGEGQFRLINAHDGTFNFTLTVNNQTIEEMITANKMYENLHIEAKNSSTFTLYIPDYNVTYVSEVYEEKALTVVFLHPKREMIELVHEDVDKSRDGDPKLMIVLSDNFYGDETVSLTSDHKNFHFILNNSYPVMDLKALPANEYNVTRGLSEYGKINLKQGGVYSLVLDYDYYYDNVISLLKLTEPNSVCILWILPQYLILTAGEIMFSVTGLEFSFTQAPESMKSLMQAVWLFTVAIGNLIVVLVARSRLFPRQRDEFLLFGSLMVVDMIIFALLAMKYKYVEDLAKEQSNELELGPTKSKESKD